MKIDLEKILVKHSNICIDDREDVINAMKEACIEVIKLAAKSAKVKTYTKKTFSREHGMEWSDASKIDRASIMRLIKDIE